MYQGFPVKRHSVIMGRMKPNTPGLWSSRLSALMLAALLAASIVYWVLRWPVAHTALPVQEVSMATASLSAPGQQALLAPLLGAGAAALDPAPAGLAARLVLSGVVASATGGGVALISVDGKPARAYAVGSPVTDGLVLQAVAPRRALLARSVQAPVDFTLEMKRPAP